ncbi:MAG: glycoside hydrolase family 19 protein [Aeromonas veronii]
MKIVYPMQLAGGNTPSEVASLDAFIEKINSLKSGTFPIGRNRIWHGGIHFSEKGGWHPSGAVRAIAEGEIVAYRLATKPAKATRSPEAGKPGDGIELHTSPSFCLVRHRYEAGEQNKNRLTFYSLYMHIACENTYNSPEAARVTIKGSGVSTYEPVAHLKLTRRLSGSNPVYAKTGAEVKLLQQTPSNQLNHRDEPHNYFLVHYVDEPNSLFYIAESQLQQEYPQKPKWMTPPEGKPARHGIPSNTWLRQSANTTAGSLGLPAGSEVVVSGEPQMVNINGGPTEFRKVQVFKVGRGTVKDSANQVMTNAGKGAIGWLAKSKMGAGLAAEASIPVEFTDDAPVVDRSANPIPVQAGEVIGHWGEHELATAGTSGFVKDADSKVVHFEVFVAESDKQALEDCINNKARVTGGQGYLLVKKEVTTYRLTNDSQHGFHDVAVYGPLVLPLAVKESDIVTHGANNFVRVRERTAADGELAGEFVLQGGDVEVVSQHDWHKLGVKLVDGSSDPDGFLDKADTEGKEGGEFFSTLYDKLVTDRDNDGTLSGNDIKAALADEELAGKLRMLFIKHKSEWVQPGEWPRLKQELADQPKLYEYAMQVHNNMAWVEDASAILGDTQPWFIHPAGIFGLVGSQKRGFIFTLDIMKRIYTNFQNNNSKDNELQGIADELNEHIEFYQLDTPLKRTHFFAQILQETGPSLSTSEGENWSVTALKGFAGGRNRRYPDGRLYADVHGYKIKDRRTGLYLKEDGSQISQLDKIEAFNTIYGNRPRDLGNGDYDTNDGWNFRGRGLKQVTGRYNYTTFNTWHRENQAMWPNDTLNAVLNPELLSDIKYATRSAAWFWIGQGTTKCFEFASEATDDAVNKITDIVNYHTDSRANRIAHFWRLWNEKVLHEN